MKSIKTFILIIVLPSILANLSAQELILEDDFETETYGLIDEAIALAQQDFASSIPIAIVELDPPDDGDKNAPGLVFEEYNSIMGHKYFDNGVFAFEARPRGSVFQHPLEIVNHNVTPPLPISYSLGNYDYNTPVIQPPLTTIPIAGQYIAGLQIIHLVANSNPASFPIILSINSSGFLRLTGEPPRTFGTSYRVATHNVGASIANNGDPFDEDFPRIVKIITKVINDERARIGFLIDSEAFTGALLCELRPGVESVMNVQATFVMRRDLSQSEEMNTGFAGMSSLFFRGEADTPAASDDEAHDADVLTLAFSDNSSDEFALSNPDTIFSMNFNAPAGQTITSFALEQQDRDPAHYSAFDPADYASRSSR